MALTSPWDDDFRAPAFWFFVGYALRHLVPQFEAECGKLNLATDALGAQIDKATGHGEAEVQRFIDWCVVQYGTPDQVDSEDTTP